MLPVWIDHIYRCRRHFTDKCQFEQTLAKSAENSDITVRHRTNICAFLLQKTFRWRDARQTQLPLLVHLQHRLKTLTQRLVTRSIVSQIAAEKILFSTRLSVYEKARPKRDAYYSFIIGAKKTGFKYHHKKNYQMIV